MGATLPFRLLKGAERHNIRWPRFSREDYYIAPEWAAAAVRRHHGDAGGRWGQRGGEPDPGVPQRHPDLLERAATRPTNLQRGGGRVSNFVPNYVVSAFLPEDLFVG